jgi:hypothetical protein
LTAPTVIEFTSESDVKFDEKKAKNSQR